MVQQISWCCFKVKLEFDLEACKQGELIGIAVITSSASALPLPTTTTITISAAAATAPSGSPAITPATPEQQLDVDTRSVPGVDRVDSLAEYLVGLRTATGQTLNYQQASTTIALWQNLLPYDQWQVGYAEQHHVRLTTGTLQTIEVSANGLDSDYGKPF
eukprot:superscaffoldBa00003160_g16267